MELNLRRLLSRGLTDEAPRNARERFLLAARSMTQYVAAEHRQLAFLVPTPSDGKLFVTGDAPEFRVLERAVAILRAADRLPPSPTIVDVGAHIGTTTIPALALHGFSHALAIEPEPENVKLLRANLALNGLNDRATVLPVAASDSEGRQPFERGTRTEGAYRWTKGRIADRSSADAVLIETVTLDGLVADGLVDPHAVGLLWLDCQKHEERVLQAASVFVERRVPIVFALRPRELGPSSPLVRQLTQAYEHVVHLRRRAGHNGAWTPQVEPIAQLAELCGRKSSTDLLVATGLGDREPKTSGTASTSAAST